MVEVPWTVLCSRWQSRSRWSTHSLMGLSFISQQFWYTVVMTMKKDHITIQTNKGQLYQQNLYMWEYMLIELLKSSSASQTRTDKPKSKWNELYLSLKFDRLSFHSCLSNQYGASEIPNSAVVEVCTSRSTAVYSNVTKLAKIIPTIETMQTLRTLRTFMMYRCFKIFWNMHPDVSCRGYFIAVK